MKLPFTRGELRSTDVFRPESVSSSAHGGEGSPKDTCNHDHKSACNGRNSSHSCRGNFVETRDFCEQDTICSKSEPLVKRIGKKLCVTKMKNQL